MQTQENIAIFIAFGCLIMFMLVLVIITFVVIYQRKMSLKEAKIQLMEQEKQIALFRAAAEAEEQQKERIANNLHDEINPLLALLKLNLSRHRIHIEKNIFKPESFNQDTDILNKAIEGIRTTCHDLIPTFLMQFGLIASLESHARQIQDINNIDTQFENTAEENDLDCFEKKDQLHIYRICMEILNNLFKHAHCTTLKIRIGCTGNNLLIEFEHNGKGVSNEEMEEYTTHSKGLGLKSLKARALILNARINYQKQEGHSSVILSIPNK
jgi:two-component system NarL family sensor kinase